MSDDRWNSEDERAPYLDRAQRPRQRSNVRPAAQQHDRRGPPTPEEIEAFIAQQFGDTEKAERKRLVRPDGWDDFIGPIQQTQQPLESGDEWEPPGVTE